MVKTLVIDIAGNQTVQQLKGLKDMQKVVGGYIELIQLQSCDVYFNEEGIAKELFPNRVITDFVRRELEKEGRVLIVGEEPSILGTAFIVGKPDKEGSETDCPFNRLPEN